MAFGFAPRRTVYGRRLQTVVCRSLLETQAGVRVEAEPGGLLLLAQASNIHPEAVPELSIQLFLQHPAEPGMLGPAAGRLFSTFRTFPCSCI